MLDSCRKQDPLSRWQQAGLHRRCFCSPYFSYSYTLLQPFNRTAVRVEHLCTWWQVYTMTSSSSLIDDICSELLACRICLEPLRHAKTLSCRHTFCEVCLDRLRDSSELTDDDDDDDDVRVLAASRRKSTISRRTTHSAAAAGRSINHLNIQLVTGGVRALR